MPKSILLFILCLSLLSLSIPLAHAIDSNLQHAPILSQFQTVDPQLYSNPQYTFIVSIIEKTYPDLLNVTLDEIKQKQNHDIGQTLFLFIYGNNSNSSEINGSAKQVPVLSHQYGTLYSIIQDSRIFDTYYRQTEEPTIVGGSDSPNAQSLESIEQQAKEFLTNNVPHLRKWQLVTVRTQVVAGKYICFTFQDNKKLRKEEYCVLSQPWLNGYLQFATPDGTIYTKGGFGCDPQSKAEDKSLSETTQKQGQSIKNQTNPNLITDTNSQSFSSANISPSSTNIPKIDSNIYPPSAQNISSPPSPDPADASSPIFNLLPPFSTDTSQSSSSIPTTGGSISLLPPISTLPSPSETVRSTNSTIHVPPSNPNGLRRLLLTIS